MHPPFSTYFDKTAYYRYSAISGTTTDTSLSLAITEHTVHRTVEKTPRQKLVAAMNAFTMAEWQNGSCLRNALMRMRTILTSTTALAIPRILSFSALLTFYTY